MSNKFQIQLKKIDISLCEEQIKKFDKYYNLLIEWNKVMNLTGITEYDDVNEKHFLDSLSIVKAKDIHTINTVIDIGTGAGFPGIPLKIIFPHLEVVLLDSLGKRVKFLNTIIEELELDNVKAIHGRAEDFAKTEEYREKFDLSVSRAVSNLSTLSEYCLPYVKVGGLFISYKSDSIEEELIKSKLALNVLGGKLKNVISFQLPDTDIGRSFVIIEKVKKTPDKYPRKAGLPEKQPILS